MKFVYTVWFRELGLPDDDPDQEWPACFVIDAESDARALEWGNGISSRHVEGQRLRVIGSSVERFDNSTLPGLNGLPIVRCGDWPSDDEIGW